MELNHHKGVRVILLDDLSEFARKGDAAVVLKAVHMGATSGRDVFLVECHGERLIAFRQGLQVASVQTGSVTVTR